MFSKTTSGTKPTADPNEGLILGFDVRVLDLFPKTMDDFRIKTTSGAIGMLNFCKYNYC